MTAASSLECNGVANHTGVCQTVRSKRRMYPRKVDVMDEIEDFVQQKIDDGLLLNMEKAWQPSDFLPDPQKPTEEWVRRPRLTS